MKYGAITIDTSIIDQHGLNLESGLLKTMEQFNGKPFPLILSEIVVRETQSHLVKKASEARAQVKKALRISKAHLNINEKNIENASELLNPKNDDINIAEQRVDTFIENTGAKVVPASGNVELDEIIKKYFNSEPPFSETGKKKKEFPDAIALMSLENWAKEHDTKILAVADDKDWEEFAGSSKYIDIIKELPDAIALFQPHNDPVAYCKTLAKELPNGKPEALISFLQQQIADAISNIEAYPEASSQFYWEPDVVEIHYESFDFIVDENNIALLQPVQAQDTSIVIVAKILINATASCSFSLSAHDSIDKDYVPIGSSSAITQIEFETEVLFTLEGDFVQLEDIDVTDFELLSTPTVIDFGDLEPDWWGDNE